MNRLGNAPGVRIALVGVSRDCFPKELTVSRLGSLREACAALDSPPEFVVCNTIIENGVDAEMATNEALDNGANAAVLYLGNFGPEGPLSIFAQNFPGPVMAIGAAEESKFTLAEDRGDAFCGMLNAAYNFNLRDVTVYIPERPVGLPGELAREIRLFASIARVLIGVRNLKIFGFGPRPQDFYACNAPIKPLYDLGVEVMENSELDLLQLVEDIDLGDPDITVLAGKMAYELGEGNTYHDLLPRLARLELALVRFAEQNLGDRHFAAFADKCWPAFEKAFGFVPCYVNGRMSARGMPVACEVDIYGALSEYMCYLASECPATLLDINNTVPQDLVNIGGRFDGVEHWDLFMGFHCGNTPACHMKNCAMKHQLIMHRLMEPDQEPDITRGTLEGQIKPGPTTFFRLQADPDNNLASYIAQGQVIDLDPCTFGGTGIFAIPNFARFYRHVLMEKRFPHHGAVAFEHVGRVLFETVKLLGIEDINVPLPRTTRYPDENPF